MKISFFTEIHGVGAASGLYYDADILYLIGDNSGYLYQYQLETKELDKVRILFDLEGDCLENILKANKPDFESICCYKNMLYIFGSGSTAERNVRISYSMQTHKVVEEDLSSFYESLRVRSTIDQDNFNIEGAVFTGYEWLLFNRGNGSLAKNGIFRIAGEVLDPSTLIQFFPIDLPKIGQVSSSFTDAVLVGKTIFFLATAEDTTSTYDDGKVLGSFIGSLDLESLEIKFMERISDTHKFEGIAVYKQTKNAIEFLLCEDKDNEETNSSLYRISLTI